MRKNLFDIADRFKPRGEVLDIQAFGSGNINDTFLVTVDSDAQRRFILQRLNTKVFRQPELVMQNMRVLTAHVLGRLKGAPSVAGRRWEMPCILLTRDAKTHWIAPDGSFWRALTFIEAVQSFDKIKDMEHAREAGYALGLFHYLTSDLPCEKLADTLPGFHIAPRYLQHYDEVLEKNSGRKSPEVEYCLKFINERRTLAHVLEDAKARGRLPLRTIHGDPKINNVLIDISTGQAVSIIDLDTVKPGLVHYDIGDLLRSGCNLKGEETGQRESVYFDINICRAVLQGYLSQARGFLTPSDYEYVYDSIQLLAFELGLRFFTDYLEGNIYFKAAGPEHNLARALVQFRLVESIESQETAIRKTIQDAK
ncbi:MAG: aminoglycoside phosphotransferase family protein [Nitrospiraceae bacterium]|nr:MAG: aminoglycoside phosphotransferase family protein [Nitrospiraceae bacterium]